MSAIFSIAPSIVAIAVEAAVIVLKSTELSAFAAALFDAEST